MSKVKKSYIHHGIGGLSIDIPTHLNKKQEEQFLQQFVYSHTLGIEPYELYKVPNVTVVIQIIDRFITSTDSSNRKKYLENFKRWISFISDLTLKNEINGLCTSNSFLRTNMVSKHVVIDFRIELTQWANDRLQELEKGKKPILIGLKGIALGMAIIRYYREGNNSTIVINDYARRSLAEFKEEITISERTLQDNLRKALNKLNKMGDIG